MKTILEALQFREWHVNKRGVAYCPVCGGKRHLGGHKRDCEYFARMKEAERLPKRLTVEEMMKLGVETIDSWKGCVIDLQLTCEAIHKATYGEEPDHE